MIPNRIWIALALKIAKILAAQVRAHLCSSTQPTLRPPVSPTRMWDLQNYLTCSSFFCNTPADQSAQYSRPIIKKWLTSVRVLPDLIPL